MLAAGRTAAASAAAAPGHRFGTVVVAGGVRRDATQPSQAEPRRLPAVSCYNWIRRQTPAHRPAIGQKP